MPSPTGSTGPTGPTGSTGTTGTTGGNEQPRSRGQAVAAFEEDERQRALGTAQAVEETRKEILDNRRYQQGATTQEANLEVQAAITGQPQKLQRTVTPEDTGEPRIWNHWDDEVAARAAEEAAAKQRDGGQDGVEPLDEGERAVRAAERQVERQEIAAERRELAASSTSGSSRRSDSR